MKRSKTILFSMAIAGALLFVLMTMLVGAGGDISTVSAQPAPGNNILLTPLDNNSTFSEPQGTTSEPPAAVEGLDFRFDKAVALWHENQGRADCDAANWSNKILVVDAGTLVRYCYRGTNIGDTKIITHTMFEVSLNSYGMKDYRYEMQPGGDLRFFTRQITITEETIADAWWQVIDENLDTLTKYQRTTVKVAIRFRGNTYDALPSSPEPYPPLSGVEMQLYGWNEGDVITESLRMTTTSDESGFWNFYMPDTYDHYRIQAVPPTGLVVVDAQSETGVKVEDGALQWNTPDRATTHISKFFFASPTPTPTPTSTPTATPTPTITPTPTATPTLPPDVKPGIWLPVVLMQ